jgi:hypothetical protein
LLLNISTVAILNCSTVLITIIPRLASILCMIN